MNLKEVLGDAYKEGMTFEEVSNFFEGKKFADLSTGNYVDKNKYESEVNSLKTQLSEKDTALKNKMSDAEKVQLAQQEKDAEIERLKTMLTNTAITSNKNTVNGITLSAREILGLDANDENYVSFVNNITTEDDTKSANIATYVSKLVKDAYEKGKKDATKEDMSNLGKGKGNANGQNDPKDELGEFGKKLASMSAPKEKFDYFKRQ